LRSPAAFKDNNLSGTKLWQSLCEDTCVPSGAKINFTGYIKTVNANGDIYKILTCDHDSIERSYNNLTNQVLNCYPDKQMISADISEQSLNKMSKVT
jgi:hypothetical protein